MLLLLLGGETFAVEVGADTSREDDIMVKLLGDILALFGADDDVVLLVLDLTHALIEGRQVVVFNDNVGVFPNCCCPVVFVATNMLT